MINQTIGALALQMQRAVIGLRRDGRDELMPDDRAVLQSDDRIMVLDEGPEEKSTSTPRHRKAHRLVIIDDNPVIVKLYSRLFQKAGFAPLTATNGRDGLDVILKNKPHAAVIDYQLPAMSGIEVCRNIRRQMNGHRIKLILFTADESPETRAQAMAAGADAVVVKSPDASEIIHTVNQFLKI